MYRNVANEIKGPAVLAKRAQPVREEERQHTCEIFRRSRKVIKVSARCLFDVCWWPYADLHTVRQYGCCRVISGRGGLVHSFRMKRASGLQRGVSSAVRARFCHGRPRSGTRSWSTAKMTIGLRIRGKCLPGVKALREFCGSGSRTVLNRWALVATGARLTG